MHLILLSVIGITALWYCFALVTGITDLFIRSRAMRQLEPVRVKLDFQLSCVVHNSFD
jgi:uncharacterized iron-regulated membrane protein